MISNNHKNSKEYYLKLIKNMCNIALVFVFSIKAGILLYFTGESFQRTDRTVIQLNIKSINALPNRKLMHRHFITNLKKLCAVNSILQA